MRLNAQTMPDEDVPAYDVITTSACTTHNGQKLSPKEDRFITLYIKYAEPAQAAREAGYSVRETIKNKDGAYLKRGNELLRKDYIRDEIAYRMEQFRQAGVADTTEILTYLTKVMRGEVKDQFGLDVSIADRTSAAKELNRRLHEIESTTSSGNGKEVHLVLRRE